MYLQIWPNGQTSHSVLPFLLLFLPAKGRGVNERREMGGRVERGKEKEKEEGEGEEGGGGGEG